MNLNFLILYCALSFVNVVIQTVKSLCTVKCSTFISACVNAIAYGLYVYVIFFTNAEGLSLWGKAIITAVANFTGVYLANFLFSKMFNKEVEWVIDVNIPYVKSQGFADACRAQNLSFHHHGFNCRDNMMVLYTVFCPTHIESEKLKKILPEGSKYLVHENIKRL